MLDINEQLLLKRAGCLNKIDPYHSYHKSYQYFVSFFANKQELTESDLIIGANFTYGWMPTILNFKSADFDQAVLILNRAKSPIMISDIEIILLKKLINNSLVGVSKLLHFVNPELYAIWDSRVCYFLTGKSYKQKVENIDLFKEYLNLCHRVSHHKNFESIHRQFICKVGYEVSPMRTLEQIMFIEHAHPLNDEN
ncbi:hypothetical protein [Vibrio algicola]|uniref:Uncharacterized protein n=1 Tax=Vibrio algicola TaxID=2662262 RepID=A0A5Q0TG82_9VIBR|nr:hypothetical protein [Vibrio algicola]